MRKLLIIFSAVLTLALGCKKDESKLDSNGLTNDINTLVPDSILAEMINLGMPIYTGENPPDLGSTALGNTYFVSPFVLVASNRVGDTPGYTFSDYTVNFYEQSNSDLTVKVDYVNGPESGTGLGGFIVGSGNDFTVFAEITSESGGTTAKMVQVISGTVTATGITDLFFANFMLDNYGNPGGIWIENGEGRIIYDQDADSPLVTTKSTSVSINKTGSAGTIK